MRFRTLITLAAASALAVPALAPAAPPPVEQILHEERSLYRNIAVTQEGDERCLQFRAQRGLGRESCKYLSRPDVFVFEYTGMMMSGLYANPNPRNILIIGQGGGTLPSALQKILPKAKIDVVELDAAVDRVSRQYFDFKVTSNTRVFIEDGRVFVKRMGRAHVKYDMIMLDAFEADYIPEHMLTQEFLREVRAILSPKGVLVANTWPNSGLYDHESATYASVFGAFYNLKYFNRIIMTRLGGLPPMTEVRANAAKLEPQLAPRGAGQDLLLPLMKTTVDWDTKARLLTDQYSPANVLNSMR